MQSAVPVVHLAALHVTSLLTVPPLTLHLWYPCPVWQLHQSMGIGPLLSPQYGVRLLSTQWTPDPGTWDIGLSPHCTGSIALAVVAVETSWQTWPEAGTPDHTAILQKPACLIHFSTSVAQTPTPSCLLLTTPSGCRGVQTLPQIPSHHQDVPLFCSSGVLNHPTVRCLHCRYHYLHRDHRTLT